MAYPGRLEGSVPAVRHDEETMRQMDDAEQRRIDAGNSIDLKWLESFVVVAEELHFGRAAARLHITQPGPSHAIARLERLLQARLFTRTRSTMELTEAGAELLHRGRRLLADLEGTAARVRMAGRGQAGLVRVGVALLAEPAVAPAQAAFHAEHASIVVDRSAMLSERLLEQLAEGRLQAAVVHQVPALATADQVTSEPLRRGRLAVLAGPHSNVAGRPMVTLSELSNQTFLVNPRTLAPSAFEGLKSCAASSAVSRPRSWNPLRPRPSPLTPTCGPSGMAPPSR
jgi:DNA-binding transcriptional LysR family regulator